MSAPHDTAPPGPAHPRQLAAHWARWLLGFTLAFGVLNALLTFENRWPGLGVHLSPRLSFELCLLTLGLLLWRGHMGPPTARALALLAAGYTLLVLVRYVDVTVPALFGRPVNIYWDGRHAGELLRLAAAETPSGHLALLGIALLLGLGLLYAVVHAALGMLLRHLAWPSPRPALLATGVALSLSFAVHPYMDRDTRWFFSLPVAPTIARQATLLPALLSTTQADARLGAGPRFDTDLAALGDADVLVLFWESYGVTAFDDPAFGPALRRARTRLAETLAAGGRGVVSARLRSPTFGGASWLAHAALLTGVDTRDPHDHDLLLTTDRPHLVRHAARHGYRTVGWMPGLQKPWPEGSFYGFERLADLHGTGYAGPSFGYWQVPDQAALALLHAQELSPAQEAGTRQPRFVVFPTLSTHMPFVPLAPYRDDWPRLLTLHAYDGTEVEAALAEPASWTRPRDAYLAAMRYAHDSLTGYLDGIAPRQLLLIVIGDHQPPAAVTGPDASWDVPVHVITQDPALRARFEAAGFVPGLTPPAVTWGAMHEFTALLLAAFDGRVPRPTAPASTAGRLP